MLSLKRKPPAPPSVEPQSRAQLVDELAGCTLNDGKVRELTAAVKQAEAALEAARKELFAENAARMARASQTTARRKEIELLLVASADPSIADAIAEVETAIVEATEARKIGDVWHPAGSGEKPVTWRSNHAAIDAFVVSAREAIRKLEALRLSAVEGQSLEKSIAKILKAVPKVSFDLCEVS